MANTLFVILILMIVCLAALIVVKIIVNKRLDSIDGAEGIAPESELEQDSIEQ